MDWEFPSGDPYTVTYMPDMYFSRFGSGTGLEGPQPEPVVDIPTSMSTNSEPSEFARPGI